MCSVCSEADVITDPVSEVVEALRVILGLELEGTDGVRERRISILVAFDTGCTSGTPFRKAKVLTCTDLDL